jgi:hypothetical protein
VNETILKTLIKQDKTYKQIAEKFKVSSTTVRYWLSKYKLNTSRKKPRKIRYCLVCDKILPYRVNKSLRYCNSNCQAEYAYIKYIEKWKKGLISGLVGSAEESSKHIRRYLFEKYKKKCGRCGWEKQNKFTNNVPLEIEHIDGNFRNHKEHNLILLCPNCHSLTKTYKGANRGKGRKHIRKKYLK